MAGREPLASVSPTPYGVVVTRWLWIVVALGLALLGVVAVTAAAGGPPPGWVILLVLAGTAVGYPLSRSRTSTVVFHGDRVVANWGTVPGLTERREVAYDEVAFVVRGYSMFPHDTFYVVHEDGVLVLWTLPQGDDIAALLEESVPPLGERARGMNQHTARWIVYDDLDGDDDIVIDKSRAKDAFGFEGADHYRFAPGRLGEDENEGIYSVDDISPGDVCLSKNRTPIYPFGR